MNSWWVVGFVAYVGVGLGLLWGAKPYNPHNRNGIFDWAVQLVVFYFGLMLWLPLLILAWRLESRKRRKNG